MYNSISHESCHQLSAGCQSPSITWFIVYGSCSCFKRIGLSLCTAVVQFCLPIHVSESNMDVCSCTYLSSHEFDSYPLSMLTSIVRLLWPLSVMQAQWYEWETQLQFYRVIRQTSITFTTTLVYKYLRTVISTKAYYKRNTQNGILHKYRRSAADGLVQVYAKRWLHYYATDNLFCFYMQHTWRIVFV